MSIAKDILKITQAQSEEKDDLVVEEVVLEQDGLIEGKEAEKVAEEQIDEAKSDKEDDEKDSDKEDEEEMKEDQSKEAPAGKKRKADVEAPDEKQMDEADQSKEMEAGKKKKADVEADGEKQMDEAKEDESEKDSDKEDEEDDEETVEEAVDAIAAEIITDLAGDQATVDVSEDISALVAEDESLTEEFKEKAATIFEAAVSSKVREVMESKQAEIAEMVEERVAVMEETINGQLDKYLTYVAEEWVKANEVAVGNMLRTEIAEDFMASLKTTFTEHYIEMPEGKVDMFDEATQKAEDAEKALEESVVTLGKVTDELETLKREKILREASEGLADTQVEKLEALVEDVEFKDDETFAKKVDTIRESYFGKKSGKSEELKEDAEDDSVIVKTEIVEEKEDSKLSPAMESYMKATSLLK